MPTLIFCCGAECGIAAGGATPGSGGVRHWDSITGVPTIDTGTFQSPGTRSYKVTTAAGAAVYIAKTSLGLPTVLVGRVYINFSSLPSADCRLVDLACTAGGFPCVFFQSSDSKLYARVGSANGATGVSVTTGIWYRLDFKGDVSGGTRTMDLQVSGTSAGQASSAIAASTVSGFRMGGNTSTTTANFTHFYDDLALGATGTDYPLGDGLVAGLSPNADGTHNFNAAGDFQYGAPGSLSNVATSATDVWTMLDDRLDNTTDVVAVPAASNTEYVEVAFGDLPTVTSVNGVEVVAACHAAATQANKQTLRINDGGTLSDVYADIDQSQTSLVYNSKHYALAPSSSAAWTKTKVDALLARWNSSYGTVDESPVPYLDALMLEVDYVVAAGNVEALPGTGVLTWTGLAPTVFASDLKEATPGVGVTTFTGLAPNAVIDTIIQPGVGALTATGLAPTVVATLNTEVLPSVGVGTFTGFAPTATITANITVTPGVGAGTFTGLAPAVAIGINVQSDVGVTTFTGLAPTVVATANQNVTPSLGAATWTGLAPAVVIGINIAPSLGVVTFSGLAPTVATSANQTVTPSLGVLTFSGIAPTITTGDNIIVTPGLGTTTWAGFSPTVSTTLQGTVQPEAGQLLWMGLSPSIRIRHIPTVDDGRIHDAIRWALVGGGREE